MILPEFVSRSFLHFWTEYPINISLKCMFNCLCRICKCIPFNSLIFYLHFQFEKWAHGSSCKFAPFHITILPQIATPTHLKLIFISTKGARRRPVTYDDHPSMPSIKSPLIAPQRPERHKMTLEEQGRPPMF